MEIRPIFSALMRSKTGAVLIAAQIALTLAIISNALYIVHDRVERSQRPSGIDEANTFFINFDAGHVPDAEAMQQRDVETLRAIPGVTSAAFSNQFPMAQSGWSSTVTTHPQDPNSGVDAANYMTPGPAATAYGGRIVEGRDFRANDVRVVDAEKTQPTADSVIITQHLAKQLFPDAHTVVGRSIYLGSGTGASRMQVIGVIDRLMTPWAQASDKAYNSFIIPVRYLSGQASYVVHTAPGQRARVMRQAEDALGTLRHDRTLTSNNGADELRANRYRGQRQLAAMLLAVTVGLLLVTGGGIVGLASLWVTQRRKQIGVRRALGARKWDILRYFLVENVIITSVGIVVGCALSLALNQFLVSHLELPRLPLPYLGIGMLTLWALGILAVYGPALRAASVSPAIATRST